MVTIRIKADEVKNEITAIESCIIRALVAEGFEVEKGETFVKVANVVVKDGPPVKPEKGKYSKMVEDFDKENNPLREVAEQIWPSKKD